MFPYFFDAQNDDQAVIRRCYPAMRHESGDVIQTRDCVLLKSGSRKNDLPYIAKIAALWENPCDGEMMFSLLWYESFMTMFVRCRSRFVLLLETRQCLQKIILIFQVLPTGTYRDGQTKR